MVSQRGFERRTGNAQRDGASPRPRKRRPAGAGGGPAGRLRARPLLEARDAAVHRVRGLVVEDVDALVLGLREERGGGDRPCLGPKTGARGMIAVKKRWWWFGAYPADAVRVAEFKMNAEDDRGRP